MLTKKSNGVAGRPRLTKALAGVVGGSMDRRTFLKRSGVAAGGVALGLGPMPAGMVQQSRKRHLALLAKSYAGQVGLHALFSRLHGDRRGFQRDMGRARAGLRQPVQPGRTLRQGCVSTSPRPCSDRRLKYPMKLGRRPVEENQLG